MTASVYVLDADWGTKVGLAYDVAARVADIGRTTGLMPRLVRSYAFDERRDAELVEQWTHWTLKDDRCLGEWFHCHPFFATEAVERWIREGTPRYSPHSLNRAAAATDDVLLSNARIPDTATIASAPLLLNVDGLAAMLGISSSAVSAAADSGSIPHVLIGRRLRRFSLSQVVDAIAGHSAAPEGL